MLSADGHVTKRKICTIMGHLGIRISLGAVCTIHRLAGSFLEKPFEEIRTAMLQSPSLNADESSWRYKRCKYWLWTCFDLCQELKLIQESHYRQGGEL